MAKGKSIFVCSACGGTALQWMGKCPHCGEWNTLLEEAVTVGTGGTGKNRFAGLTQASPVTALAEIEATETLRTPCGIDELDRVLGGGLVSGGVILIGGDPGI
ncbi:MAG: DNA repair protein RadA, partial [Saezia sp.]